MQKIKTLRQFIKENLSDEDLDIKASGLQSQIQKTESTINKVQQELFELNVRNVDKILNFGISMLKKDLQDLQSNLNNLKSELQKTELSKGKTIPGFE